MCVNSRLVSDKYPDEVNKTVDCLSPNLTGVYDAHRITVVSFYSEVGPLKVYSCLPRSGGETVLH